MKKLSVAFLLLFTTGAGAQITFETNYTNNIYYDPPGVVHLSAAGDKYAFADTNQVILYNLNHSVYRTITVPTLPSGCFNFRIMWISDELFNTNPLDIEYLMQYETVSTGQDNVRVFDEAGNVLFARDSFSVYGPLGYGLTEWGIVHTSAGVKMILRSVYASTSAVYSLPGVLPCHMCDGGVISGIQPLPSGQSEDQQQLPNPYPNPTNSTTTIPYSLPEGTSTGFLVVYDMAGREVKRYTVTNAFSSLVLSAEDLANGTYTYSIQTGQTILPGRQFIIAK